METEKGSLRGHSKESVTTLETPKHRRVFLNWWYFPGGGRKAAAWQVNHAPSLPTSLGSPFKWPEASALEAGCSAGLLSPSCFGKAALSGLLS